MWMCTSLITNNVTRYLNGIPLEKYVCRFFEINGLGSQVDHNNFNPYFYPLDNHNVVDVVIKDKALIECTNPKETTFLNDEIMLNKLDYFNRKDPSHLLVWFLVVSFAVFSNAIRQLIDKLGITLIVLNDYATRTNRQTFIRHLFRSKLYSLAKRLKPKPKKSGSTIQYSITSLPQYSVSSDPLDRTLDRTTHLHQHRSTTENSTQEDALSINDRFPDRPRFDNKPRFN